MKWPASQGASFALRRVVVSAGELGEEPFGGKALCPFTPLRYGIDSISGMSKRLSNSSGRPIVRFKTNPLNSVSAMPKANPPPASPNAILSRVSCPEQEEKAVGQR